MKRKILILIFTIGLPACQLLAQIPWQQGRQLTWGDFQGSPDPKSDFWAFTRYNINYKYNWDGSGTITFNFNCTFNENESWKRPEKKLTEKLLRHEQLHFDVAELYTRKMRQAFAGYVAFHKHTGSSDGDLKAIFAKLLAESQKYNDDYDRETDHSKIVAKQAEWDARITDELNRFSAYGQR